MFYYFETLFVPLLPTLELREAFLCKQCRVIVPRHTFMFIKTRALRRARHVSLNPTRCNVVYACDSVHASTGVLCEASVLMV